MWILQKKNTFAQKCVTVKPCKPLTCVIYHYNGEVPMQLLSFWLFKIFLAQFCAIYGQSRENCDFYHFFYFCAKMCHGQTVHANDLCYILLRRWASNATFMFLTFSNFSSSILRNLWSKIGEHGNFIFFCAKCVTVKQCTPLTCVIYRYDGEVPMQLLCFWLFQFFLAQFCAIYSRTLAKIAIFTFFGKSEVKNVTF